MNRTATPTNGYKLTNAEKETVILFNEADGTAEIETFSAKLLRQLRKVRECDGVICEEKKPGYGAYIIPKGMIKIQAPPSPSKMSKEKRAELSERMKAINKQRREEIQNQF